VENQPPGGDTSKNHREPVFRGPCPPRTPSLNSSQSYNKSYKNRLSRFPVGPFENVEAPAHVSSPPTTRNALPPARRSHLPQINLVGLGHLLGHRPPRQDVRRRSSQRTAIAPAPRKKKKRKAESPHRTLITLRRLAHRNLEPHLTPARSRCRPCRDLCFPKLGVQPVVASHPRTRPVPVA